jgi:predicted nucleotidyltransferase
MIYLHHQRAIDKLVEKFRDDPRFPALLISGSVASGRAKEHSDVDVLFIATEEEFERRRARRDYFYFDNEITDYEHGYIDGKVVNLQYLRDCAERGSEPSRFAFLGTWAAYSRIDDIDDLLKRIYVYPEHQQAEKIEAFYSQVQLLSGFFMGCAEGKDNPYLRHMAAGQLVLYGGRLILAHNKMLFPCHKTFLAEVAAAPDKPAEFLSLAKQALTRPGKETAHAFRDCLNEFRRWDEEYGVNTKGAVARFVEDIEWQWWTGRPALMDY